MIDILYFERIIDLFYEIVFGATEGGLITDV